MSKCGEYKLDMRYILERKTLVLLICFLGCGNQQNLSLEIDHIVIAINDLQKGMEQFEDLTGVKPVYGGTHPDGNTQNAIVSLENHIYIEILAPKDDLDSTPEFFRDFDDLTLTQTLTSIFGYRSVSIRQTLDGWQSRGR